MTPDERNQLIDDLVDGAIGEADFLRLEAELSVDPAARKAYYDRLTLAALLENEAAGGGGRKTLTQLPRHRPQRLPAPWLAAAAAAVALLAALAGWSLRRPGAAGGVTRAGAESGAGAEQQVSGYAVVAGHAHAVWKDLQPAPAEGSLLPARPLELESGVVQIELFSGVTVIAEGPAAFEVTSPMEMSVERGKVRAHVPEPAHGFRVRTAGGDVVDLGTEFAIDVTQDRSELHVLDGEVEWHPAEREARELRGGEALRWNPAGEGSEESPLAADGSGFVGTDELRDRLAVARRDRREGWGRFSDALRDDPRLAVYYRMAPDGGWSRRLPNLASAGAGRAGEAAIVAAEPSVDRWGNPDGALDFSPAGSRVRFTANGEFRSLTLLAWVKIHSLDRWYNSLFLTDGHDLHEPHWQIMDDGRLFFSVKKHDNWNPSKGEKDKHIFFSPPFWDASLSGQWMMVATTYDVGARQVTHFINGEPISTEAIPAEYLVESVNIGNASLGNWGLPERDDPRFAVRNLNGSMGEFALFTSALEPDEISEIYHHGKP